jgi:dimethylglycine dehydrogenase
VYERNPRHWKTEGAEWDYGMELLPEDIDRISPELLIGFERFPTLAHAGIRKWVNGAFTFTPDGNPLVGPVPGLRNFWAACGCMGGFSQGGAIGKVLADWIVEGDPGTDIFGMDVARYGRYAADDAYLRATTAQFYARRFVIAYPNEELPAGRPLKTTPSYAAQLALGARFGVVWGMESPQYFATGEPDFVDPPTARRPASDRFVADEVAATRQAAGLLDTGVYARYEVTGHGAGRWLDHLVASRMPDVGRIRLAPMLNPGGRLMGDLTVTRLAADRYWLVGSYYLQEWHLRWFREHLPSAGVHIDNLSESWLGFSLSGPRSRDILAALTSSNVADRSLPFMGCASVEVAGIPAVVARLSLTGELGFEINVPAACQQALWQALMAAGTPLGMRPIGMRAQDSLRLEKGYGVWSLEFSTSCTPDMAGLGRFVAPDKGDFIGRAAYLAAQATGPDMKLALLQVESPDADATSYEPIYRGDRRIGYVTSGAYGHHVQQSLALAYIDSDSCQTREPLTVTIIGQPRPARILQAPPYDPAGTRLRG